MSQREAKKQMTFVTKILIVWLNRQSQEMPRKAAKKPSFHRSVRGSNFIRIGFKSQRATIEMRAKSEH
jgi:hypothetical protein